MFGQLMKVGLKTLIVSNGTIEDIHAWDELQKKISSKNGVGAAATCSLKKVLANLKGKRLYWSFFLIKFQAWRPEISETFENIIFKDFWKISASDCIWRECGDKFASKSPNHWRFTTRLLLISL